MVIDSNIIIYATKPENEKLRFFISSNFIICSQISVIETLGYHLLNERDKTFLENFFHEVQMLKSKITMMQTYFLFIDEMVEGNFKSIKHEHHFKKVANGTMMIDMFEFEMPYGKIGRLLSKLFLKRYLERLLRKRNEIIKAAA